MAKLITRRAGGVGWILFSNPARMNALTLDMWKALPDAVGAFDADPAVRVIVLAGDGDKAFVSGADVSQFDQARATPQEQDSYNQDVEAAYLAPTLAAKPVVAKIRGVCMGGGLGLAAACDVRFAADDAVFRMPAARLGLGYSFVGMRRFVHVLGAANAADVFFSARKFDAGDALAMGFVSRVFPAADLDREVEAYCAMVAENAPLTLVAAKTAIREVLKDAQARDLAALQRQIDACYESADYAEGRAAFKSKRAPRFRGV
ncbi:MAG: enoyl-CoA hydratase [Burkholderiales bacterium]|nr:enoyl-CoA hydratase [Burkholderiales bacterium]